ncbi:MAG: hypothetical protein WCJ55_01950 [Chloroflexales bacterium]
MRLAVGWYTGHKPPPEELTPPSRARLANLPDAALPDVAALVARPGTPYDMPAGCPARVKRAAIIRLLP